MIHVKRSLLTKIRNYFGLRYRSPDLPIPTNPVKINQLTREHIDRIIEWQTLANWDLGHKIPYDHMRKCWWFACVVFEGLWRSPYAPQTTNATSLPFKTFTGTAYHWLYIRICNTTQANFDGAAALSCVNVSLRCGWNRFSVGAPTLQFPEDVAARQQRFEAGDFIYLDGLPSQIDKLRLLDHVN